jgi:hypothetical protein
MILWMKAVDPVHANGAGNTEAIVTDMLHMSICMSAGRCGVGSSFAGIGVDLCLWIFIHALFIVLARRNKFCLERMNDWIR